MPIVVEYLQEECSLFLYSFLELNKQNLRPRRQSARRSTAPRPNQELQQRVRRALDAVAFSGNRRLHLRRFEVIWRNIFQFIVFFYLPSSQFSTHGLCLCNSRRSGFIVIRERLRRALTYSLWHQITHIEKVVRLSERAEKRHAAAAHESHGQRSRRFGKSESYFWLKFAIFRSFNPNAHIYKYRLIKDNIFSDRYFSIVYYVGACKRNFGIL